LFKRTLLPCSGKYPATLTFADLQSALTALEDAKTAYQSLLVDVLAATGNSGADLMSGNLVAGDSNQDTLLDVLKVDVAPNGITLTTLAGASDDTPTQLQFSLPQTAAQVRAMDKILLPTTASIGGTPLNMSSNGISAANLVSVQRAFSTCFSSTVSQRQPGNSLCTGIVVDSIASAALLPGTPANYLSNGADALAQFSPYLNDQGMDNARFGLPQIIKIMSLDANGKADKPWLNLTWVRSDGLVDNFDGIAQIVTVPSATDSGWRLIGNQRAVLSRVRPYAVRRIWLNPDNQVTGTSAYDAELQVAVGVADKDGKTVDFAVATGPGLPAAGLLLRPSLGTCDHLNITAQLESADMNGDDATVAKQNYRERPNCANKFRVAGVAVDPAQQASFVWPVRSRNWLFTPLTDVQVQAIKPLTKYRIRIYQNGVSSAPAYDYTMSILGGLVAPIHLRAFTWQDASAASLVNGDTEVKPTPAGTAISVNVPSDDRAVPFPGVNLVSLIGNSSFVDLQYSRSSGLYVASDYGYDK
jgi:hypothetical protein